MVYKIFKIIFYFFLWAIGINQAYCEDDSEIFESKENLFETKAKELLITNEEFIWALKKLLIGFAIINGFLLMYFIYDVIQNPEAHAQVIINWNNLWSRSISEMMEEGYREHLQLVEIIKQQHILRRAAYYCYIYKVYLGRDMHPEEYDKLIKRLTDEMFPPE